MDATSPLEPAWFYVNNGQKIGPVSHETILALLRDGVVTRETAVWRQGFPDWLPVYSTELLGKISAEGPPPLPPSQINNKLAWAIALVPIVGPLIQRAISDRISLDNDATAIIFVYFIVNTALILWDANQIEKSGNNPKGLSLKFWFWIVPIYLFRRATVLKQSRMYFFAWITAFVVGIFIQQPNILSETTYWGDGIPECDSNYAKKQVQTIFKDIPLVKINSLYAVRVGSTVQTSLNGDVRSCRGAVEASNGNNINVVYTIRRTNDQIYIYVNIAQ